MDSKRKSLVDSERESLDTEIESLWTASHKESLLRAKDGHWWTVSQRASQGFTVDMKVKRVTCEQQVGESLLAARDTVTVGVTLDRKTERVTVYSKRESLWIVSQRESLDRESLWTEIK